MQEKEKKEFYPSYTHIGAVGNFIHMTALCLYVHLYGDIFSLEFLGREGRDFFGISLKINIRLSAEKCASLYGVYFAKNELRF